MVIPHAAALQTANEDIVTVCNFSDFDKDLISQIADNIRWPGGRVAGPAVNSVAGATISTIPFVFRTKSQHRLRLACDLVRFSEMIGRPLTMQNIQWDPVMRWFKELWDVIKDLQKGNDPDTPRISAALTIIR